MSKPILLLDVDGVLANFVDATLTALKHIAMNHVLQPRYTHDDITTWGIFDSLSEHEHLRDATYNELKRPGGCLSIPVYPGAQAAVETLKELVDIVVVTSPFKGSETWVHERELWLEKHFGISHRDVIHTGRKELVDGDIFVDDKVDHVVKWAKDHPTKWALLWAQRYNEKGALERQTNVRRVKGWEELIESVKDISTTRLR